MLDLPLLQDLVHHVVQGSLQARVEIVYHPLTNVLYCFDEMGQRHLSNILIFTVPRELN